MLERKTIKRRFSLEDDFMNYHVDDILYAYLQTLATTTKGDNMKTYLSKRNYELNRKGIYVACDLNSRSLKARMETFINNGLIVEEYIDTDYNKAIPAYVFTKESRLYQLIDLEIVKHLVQTKNKNSVKIFVYLANRYKWKQSIGEETYDFTIKELITAIGYSGKSRNAPLEELVNHILQDLRMTRHIGYIEYYDTELSDNNTITPIPKKRLTYVAEHTPYRDIE